MKKLIFISIIALLYACNETNEKNEISKSDSLSAAIDSAAQHDTLLLKIQKDTLTKTEKK